MTTCRMGYIINPKYCSLHDFVISLPEKFNSMTCMQILRSGRNEVRLFLVDGQMVVVKCFRRISLLNRLLYGTIRQSKSVRAYYHAFRLNRLGISTPEPIAAIDVRRYGFLTQSFYVYAYSEYNDIKELLDRYPDEQIEPLLDALTDFILRIHDKGVLHHDLNILNILYRDCGSGRYDFQLIDINRMSFYPKLSEHQRLANLRHFNCKPAVLIYILERYAAAMNIDCEMVQMRCVSMRFIDTIRHKFKQQLKCRFRR